MRWQLSSRGGGHPPSRHTGGTGFHPGARRGSHTGGGGACNLAQVGPSIPPDNGASQFSSSCTYLSHSKVLCHRWAFMICPPPPVPLPPCTDSGHLPGHGHPHLLLPHPAGQLLRDAQVNGGGEETSVGGGRGQEARGGVVRGVPPAQRHILLQIGWHSCVTSPLLAGPHSHRPPPPASSHIGHLCDQLLVPLAEPDRHRHPADVHRHRRRVLGGTVQPGPDGTPH